MAQPTAKSPLKNNNRQYHINCRRGDLASYILMPGDPGRVPIIAQNWEQKKEIAFSREYRSFSGRFKGVGISCLSVGIGAPSAAIAIEESARLGVKTFIRVGSTGALDPKINIGDLIINTGAVRLEGTSKIYIKSEYPALADHEVVLALIEACEKLSARGGSAFGKKIKYYVGLTASTDGFYVGEGRPGFNGYNQSDLENILPDLQKAKVINMEMETSVLFTLASLYGLRAGAICAVFDNLITDKWKIKGEKEAGLVASEAVVILNQWDKVKKAKKKKYFYPSLITLV